MIPGLNPFICATPEGDGSVIKIGDVLVLADPMPGWLECDGRWVSVDDYPFLFAAIGHRFSGGWIRRFIAGRGRPGMFRLPDSKQAESLFPWAGLSQSEYRAKLDMAVGVQPWA